VEKKTMLVNIELFRNGKWEGCDLSRNPILTYYVTEDVWELAEGKRIIFTSEESVYWRFDAKGDNTIFIFDNKASNAAEISRIRLTLDTEAYDLFDEQSWADREPGEKYIDTKFYLTPPAAATGQVTETGSGSSSNTGLIIGLLAVAGIAYMATKKKGGK
jgi:LPXTG-motif cell wall-anchored protein